MNFVSYPDLHQDLMTWAQTLEWVPDAVIGVPRSGMVPAAMLALHWNVHLGEPNSLLSNALSAGFRAKNLKGRPVDDVLVVDDAITSGTSLGRVLSPLRKEKPDLTLRTLAVYATQEARGLVDHHARLLSHPRLFAWNFAHHGLLKHACMDIDGVLCQDPAAGVDDDGPRYREFLLNTRPVHVPTWPVHSLVSCRLEKYRIETEQWLCQHGVQYQHLVLMPYATRDERRAAKNHASFKADYYVRSDTSLFIESSITQAQKIFELTGKPVLCTDRMKMFGSR